MNTLKLHDVQKAGGGIALMKPELNQVVQAEDKLA